MMRFSAWVGAGALVGFVFSHCSRGITNSAKRPGRIIQPIAEQNSKASEQWPESRSNSNKGPVKSSGGPITLAAMQRRREVNQIKEIIEKVRCKFPNPDGSARCNGAEVAPCTHECN